MHCLRSIFVPKIAWSVNCWSHSGKKKDLNENWVRFDYGSRGDKTVEKSAKLCFMALQLVTISTHGSAVMLYRYETSNKALLSYNLLFPKTGLKEKYLNSLAQLERRKTNKFNQKAVPYSFIKPPTETRGTLKLLKVHSRRFFLTSSESDLLTSQLSWCIFLSLAKCTWFSQFPCFFIWSSINRLAPPWKF